MRSCILSTKLFTHRPGSGLINRPRLNNRLDGILTFPLTLVSAPAGFGKSTLISSWIQSQGKDHVSRFRTAWLSLDPEDDHPVRFWEYFLAVIQALKLDNIRMEYAQSLLQDWDNPPFQLLLTDLINQIAEQDLQAVLVFDDLQALQNPEIIEGLVFLVDHLPPELHLVLITRTDPPFPLGRWRVRGLLSEIRSAQLRFDLEETGHYFNQLMKLPLTGTQINALEDRTEGWIAGLQMAAISLRDLDPGGVSKFISGFSGQQHLILDYLTDEVLNRQSELVQQFLLKSSILSLLYAPLCEAVVYDHQDQKSINPAATVQLLEKLEHDNLFLIPLDGNRDWYRCHHLFRDLLLVRLRESFPDEIQILHRRAAIWYENNGFPFEAMHHALAAQDVDLAADVIERTIRKPGTWSTGNISRMLDAVNSLPEEAINTRPWMRVYLSGILYVGGFLENADLILARLEESLGNVSDQDQLHMYINVYRAYYAVVRGDVKIASKRAQYALDLLPDDDLTVRGHALSTLGWAHYLTGNVEQASEFLERAIQEQRRKNANFTTITWLCNLANVQMVQGKLHKAAKSCEEAITVGTSNGEKSPTVGLAKIYLGEIFYKWNKLDESEQQILDGISMMQNGGITPNFGLAYSQLAQVYQANGKPGEALAMIQIGIQVAKNSMLRRYVEIASAMQIRIFMGESNSLQTLKWAEEFQKSPEPEYLREYCELTLAAVHLKYGRVDDSISLLKRLIALTESSGRFGVAIEALVLLSVGLYSGYGQNEDAQIYLRRAINLAAPENNQRIFIEYGLDLIDLLKQMEFSDARERKFIDQILSVFSVRENTPSCGINSIEKSNQPDMFEHLTGREMEILRLISIGLTNAEIARNLHVTLNTMRAHTTNIYGKLGVHNRTEAAAKATKLKLL